MKLSSLIYSMLCFMAAATVCVLIAIFSARLIEEVSKEEIRRAWIENDLGWAEIEADGLQLFIFGDSQNEVDRFRAVSVAGTVVDATRLIDQINVTENSFQSLPGFGLEILRSPDAISVVGLVPGTVARDALMTKLRSLSGDKIKVSDLLESIEMPAAENWSATIRLALVAVQYVSYAKISVTPGKVSIYGLAATKKDKENLLTKLARENTSLVNLVTEILVPRSAISPFTFRAVKFENYGRIDACAADNQLTKEQISMVVKAAGFETPFYCQTGLGMPDQNWVRVIDIYVKTLGNLESGSLTISDTEITLIVPNGTRRQDFDALVADLRQKTPIAYQLKAVLQEPSLVFEPGKGEFIVTLSPEGFAQLRGGLSDELTKTTVTNMAKARFGQDKVHTAIKIRPELSPQWSIRVLAGLETLSFLKRGSVSITDINILLSGMTELETGKSSITKLLSNILNPKDNYEINVSFQPPAKKKPSKLSAVVCIEKLDVLLEKNQIKFEPGSDKVDPQGQDLLDLMAKVLETCQEMALEISGHTDSQGREGMNQSLSQSRATAVLNEIQRRRVLTSKFIAKGYGESQPIAENDTEEGRETNRRIEFRLLSNLNPSLSDTSKEPVNNE